jgi:hypothetical protein
MSSVEHPAEHAIQAKLDAILKVLLDQNATDQRPAQQELRDAIRHDDDV